MSPICGCGNDISNPYQFLYNTPHLIRNLQLGKEFGDSQTHSLEVILISNLEL